MTTDDSSPVGVAGPGIDVVLPVRNMSDLALECIELVQRQLGPHDKLIVVDDASTDSTAATLRARRVSVIELPRQGGPYMARNVAVEQSDAEAIVFLDARSRPREGWLEAHRTLLADPDTALSCTGTAVARRPGFAPRVFRASNMFEMSSKLGVTGRLAFYPTANLGVRRTSYRAVGGFRNMISGGDADLCWRVQLAGQGALRADSRILMEWIPRDTMRAVVQQWIRYARSSAYLEAVYAMEHGDQGTEATTRRSLPSALRQTARQWVRTPVGTTVQVFLDALNVVVYLRERRRYRRIPPVAPTPFLPPQGRASIESSS